MEETIPTSTTLSIEVQRMALATPTSWNEDAKTFEIVVSSERDVGDGVILLHSPQAFRMPSRPVPTTLDHSRRSEDVWGVLETLRIESVNGVPSLIAVGRVDGTESAMAAAVPRLRNGSARFSIGARVHAWAENQRSDAIMVATDWEMGETSMVVVGMDSTSLMRGYDHKTLTDTATTEMETNQAAAAAPEPSNSTAIESPAEIVAKPGSESDESTASLERSVSAVRLERDILRACVEAGLDAVKTDEIVRGSSDYATATRQIFSVMRQNLSQSPAGHPARIAVTRDEGDSVERSIRDAFAFRLGTIKEPTDAGRRFVRRRSIDMIEGYLTSRGVNVNHLTTGQLIDRAFHSTSDFPLILADSATKRLMGGYEEEPQSWKEFSSQRNLPDFKPVNNVQLEGRLALTRTLEGGEYTGMTLTEGRSTWQLATYTGRLVWTRQMIVNDDLAAFEKIIMKAGRGARTTETDIVWGLLTTGAVTGGQTYGGGAIAGISGAAVFAQASANTGAGAIGTTGVNAARTTMGKQKDIAGNELNLFPAMVLVPTSKATVAEQFFFAPNFAPNTATGDNGPNVFAGKIKVIADNRLETRDSNLWYMVVDPRRIETIEYGYLAGEEGPQISVTDRRNPDGAELLVRMDFGAAIQDFRGFYRSTGV